MSLLLTKLSYLKFVVTFMPKPSAESEEVRFSSFFLKACFFEFVFLCSYALLVLSLFEKGAIAANEYL